MAWQDRLANWADGLIQRFPAVDLWFERHFHALGFHGPYVRHLLKTRLLPLVVVLSAGVLVLLIAMLLRRIGRGRQRPRPPRYADSRS